MFKDIICPYCNNEFYDADFAEEASEEWYEKECPECNKDILVKWEVFISFDVKKI